MKTTDSPDASWLGRRCFSSTLSFAQAADVTLWSFLDPAADGARSEALRDVIATFEAANPGTTVKTNVVEWDQIVPSLMRAAQAGSTPDIAMAYSPDLPSLDRLRRGHAARRLLRQDLVGRRDARTWR